jgi:hypothetical protein
MGVAARSLEGGEHGRRLRAARDHEALAEHKILEPPLRRYHAVLGRIEVGHAAFPALFFEWLSYR